MDEMKMATERLARFIRQKERITTCLTDAFAVIHDEFERRNGRPPEDWGSPILFRESMMAKYNVVAKTQTFDRKRNHQIHCSITYDEGSFDLSCYIGRHGPGRITDAQTKHLAAKGWEVDEEDNVTEYRNCREVLGGNEKELREIGKRLADLYKVLCKDR